MDEFTVEIRIRSQAAGDAILPDELELLESILPELLLAMIQAAELGEDA